MYVKITKSGPRRYVQLVESFRDENGRSKQRTIASLGRLENLDSNVDSVIAGLLRAAGREAAPASSDTSGADPSVSFDSSRAIGDVVDVDLFVLQDVRRVHQFPVDGHTTLVVQIGLSHRDAVDFRLQ